MKIHKILVTGNKGFIATHLIESLKYKYPKSKIIGFEINDNPLDFKYEHYDVIFHLASIARTVDCTEDPFGQSFKSNIELTNILLKHFSYDKFIYASSCAIYGNQIELPIKESNLPNPPSIYAAQKLYSENLINMYHQKINKPSICLRLFNTYGKGQSQLGSYPNVIASMIKCYKENGYVEVTGDGTQSRDFVYVSEVVRAFIMSMNIGISTTINICSGKETNILTLARYITNKIHFIEKREFDIYKQRGDYSYAQNFLGWSTTFTLKDDIERTLKFEGLL